MSISRKSIADAIDEYDAQIGDLQDGKRDTFVGYRAQLVAEGLDKDSVKAEIEAVKKAIRRRQIIAEKGVETVEQKDALTDEVFAEITARRAPRATRVEIVRKFPSGSAGFGDEDAADEAVPAAPHEPAAPATTPPGAIAADLSDEGTNSAQPEPLSSDAQSPVLDPASGTDEGGPPSLAGVEGDADRQPIQKSTAARMDVQASSAAGAPRVDNYGRTQEIGGGDLIAGVPIPPVDTISEPDKSARPSGDGLAAPVENVTPLRKQWAKDDKPHPDCLKPELCGGFSNLKVCQSCREAAQLGQVA